MLKIQKISESYLLFSCLYLFFTGGAEDIDFEYENEQLSVLEYL